MSFPSMSSPHYWKKCPPHTHGLENGKDARECNLSGPSKHAREYIPRGPLKEVIKEEVL